MPIVATSTPLPSVSKTPTSFDLVREFKRGIKWDITQFIALKDDAMWDNWNRSTIAQARAQDIAHVLDPTYIPPTHEARELFIEQQKFMYAVFEKNPSD